MWQCNPNLHAIPFQEQPVDGGEQREPIDALEVFEVCSTSAAQLWPAGMWLPLSFGLLGSAAARTIPNNQAHTCCAPPFTHMQHIRDIVDPEHPYTLEQLNVVTEEQVEVDDVAGTVQVRLGWNWKEVE